MTEEEESCEHKKTTQKEVQKLRKHHRMKRNEKKEKRLKAL